jgi:DNA-binding MarR family transcriptional regulator
MSSIMRNSVDNVNHRVALKDTSKDEPSDDDALELVHGVMHAYRSLQYRFLRDGPHDITHMDGKVLGYFQRHPGATQSDLAQHSGRDKAQLARLIKGLRDRGLLDAEVDAVDRRQVRLSLTGDGRAVQRALRKQALSVGAQAVAGLSADEYRLLCGLLRRVQGNLEVPG